MIKRRPTMFIGSSAEGLAIAEAIQLNLDYRAEVTIWSQGVFGLGEGTLEALVKRLGGFDFATLVLTPDDLTLSRGEENPSPRDNVLLELGLCIGGLGCERSFIVYDRDSDIKLPSDLAGVTPATYQQHADGNLQAALGAVTTQIKGSIERLGINHPKLSAEVDEETQFQIIHDLMDDAPEQLFILMHETNAQVQRESHLFGGAVQYNYYLKNQGAGHGGISIDDLCNKLADADLLKADLRNRVSLTDRGKQFAQWLIDNGHKAECFQSTLGTWGTPPGKERFPWPYEPMPARFQQPPPANDPPE